MSQSPPSPPSAVSNALSGDRKGLDDALSQRFIALDPAGYFLIKVDAQRQELVAEHYANTINDRGLATDPETGEVIRCQGAEPRKPLSIYRGRTAKELGILLTEGEGPFPITSLDHALYLGRELQKAEQCLNAGQVYIQD
ncbi:MAG: DUF4346 domain-containing protein [Cyanobacteriota bacterium]